MAAVSEVTAPTAVNITAANTGTVALGAGSTASGTNRILVVSMHAYEDDGWAMDMTSLSFGGQAMTIHRNGDQPSGVPKTHLVIATLDEAGIAAATDDELDFAYTVSGSRTVDAVTVIWALYENVDQSNPVSTDRATVGSTVPASLNSNSVPDDGLLLAQLTALPSGLGINWPTANADLTEEVEQDNADGPSGITCSWASYFNTNGFGTSEDVSFGIDSGTLEKYTITLIVLDPSPEQTVTIDLVTETDTAFDPNAAQDQSVPIDLVTETDTAFDPGEVIGAVTVTIDLVTETDSAFDPVVFAERVDIIDLVTETDSAFDPVVVIGTSTIPIPIITETDTAFQVASGSDTTVTIDLVTETDTAFPVLSTIDTTVTIDLVTETDTAFALTIDQVPLVVVLDLLVEVDEAPAVTAVGDTGVLAFDQNGDLLDFATVNTHLEYLYERVNAGLQQAAFDAVGIVGREHIVRPRFWGSPRYGMTGRVQSRYGWLENAQSRPTPDRFALGRRSDRDTMSWWTLSGDAGEFRTRFGTSLYVPVETRANVTCQFTLAVTERGWTAPGPETPAQVMGRMLISRRRRAAGQTWSDQQHSAMEIYPDDTRAQMYCLASVRLVQPGDYDLQLVWQQDGHDAPEGSIVQLDVFNVSWAVDVYPIFPGAE